MDAQPRRSVVTEVCASPDLILPDLAVFVCFFHLSGKTHSMDGCSYSTKQVVVPAGTPVTVEGETAAQVKTKTVRVIREVTHTKI